MHSQGTWRCTCVILLREMLTLRVRFPAGAGGGAQAGSAGAADGEEAGSCALSFGCFITPRFLKCGKEGGKKCPLHLLASKLLSVLPLPEHGPRESPLPSSALPAHLELFPSCFATAEFKKRILSESRHQLIHKTQISTRRCQPQLESISLCFPRIQQQTPAHSRFLPAPAARVQRQLHPQAALGREKKGSGRSLFSRGLVEGQSVPYLPPPSRVGTSCCSPLSQLGGGLMGQARGVDAFFGQAEQLLGQLLIPHHLPGQTRSKELLKSPLVSTSLLFLVCAPGRHPLPKSSFNFNSVCYVQI